MQIISWMLEETSWRKLMEFERLSAQNFSKLDPSLSLAVMHKANYSSFSQKRCTVWLWSQTTLSIISLRSKDLNWLWIHQPWKVPLDFQETMFVQRNPSLGDMDMVWSSLCSTLLWLFMYFIYTGYSHMWEKGNKASCYIYSIYLYIYIYVKYVLYLLSIINLYLL